MQRGRDFSPLDRDEAPFVAIVNDALARQAFGDADPLGRRIACGLDSREFMTIVGVVGNVRSRDPSRSPAPEIYMPFCSISARPRRSPSSRAPRVSRWPRGHLRETIRTANPGVPVRATTMTQVLSTAVATPRFRTLLVGVFAALALALAMAGVYGVMAYAVSRRTSEIGVRIAMGASRPAILRLVLGQGLQLAAAGIGIGSVLAFALSRALRSMLFAIGPTDPIVFVGVPILLLVTAAAATAIPALRASRIDPIQALRAE